MKSQFYSTYKIASQIVFCVLIVFSLFFTSLSYKQEVVEAQGNPESWEQLITSLIDEGKQEEALKAADEYIHRFNTRVTYSWGLNAKGNILSLMGKYTKAIYAYQESLKYDDGTSEFIMLMNIGGLQHALGDYTDAISYYEEAIIRLDSNDPRRYWLKMLVAWSDFYLSKGDTVVLKQAYDRAKPILHKIENRLNPFNKGSAYILASAIASQLGRFHDAIQLSKTYVNIKNTDSSKLDLATELLYLKKNADANEVFRRVDLRNISKGSLALWYWLKDDEMQARIHLERYLVEEYSSEVARENARRIIRKDEILAYDMWKEARTLDWFRELVYSNTIDYQEEKHSEQLKKRSQGKTETSPKNNQEKVLKYSSTTVFSTEASNVFHKPDCSKLDKSGDLIEFATSQQASKAGLLPCNYCRP
jgi:tetratricopeptide (TPR) repeat protein